jgi:hypothetical protein
MEAACGWGGGGDDPRTGAEQDAVGGLQGFALTFRGAGFKRGWVMDQRGCAAACQLISQGQKRGQAEAINHNARAFGDCCECGTRRFGRPFIREADPQPCWLRHMHFELLTKASQ